MRADPAFTDDRTPEAWMSSDYRKRLFWESSRDPSLGSSEPSWLSGPQRKPLKTYPPKRKAAQGRLRVLPPLSPPRCRAAEEEPMDSSRPDKAAAAGPLEVPPPDARGLPPGAETREA
ncbi:synaptonemal complex protein 2-like [Talpa occidentalis]|uniref:synaptonemal complex protein 2-like n=1 Tax=Talpa occidentalis TaxID=50954 RepID=UPI00188F1709|nr:synaptonemal complex protein 2-like [Talpa occidentalis]